jgi:hypothetical protein
MTDYTQAFDTPSEYVGLMSASGLDLSYGVSVLSGSVDISLNETSQFGMILSLVPFDGPAVPTVVNYAQRIWDVTNARWVYYTKTSLDSTPDTGETSPTHSGNLRAASHELLYTRTG